MTDVRSFLRANWADLLSAALIIAYYGVVALVAGSLLIGGAPTVFGDAAEGATLPWWHVEAGTVVFGATSLGIERTLLVLSVAAGAMGSVLHGMRFSVLVAKGRHDWRWTFWHVFQPLKGAILGFAVYVALRAGLAVLDGSVEPPSSPYAVLFAAMVGGLFAHETLEWLRMKGASIFPKTNSTPGSQEDQP